MTKRIFVLFTLLSVLGYPSALHATNPVKIVGQTAKSVTRITTKQITSGVVQSPWATFAKEGLPAMTVKTAAPKVTNLEKAETPRAVMLNWSEAKKPAEPKPELTLSERIAQAALRVQKEIIKGSILEDAPTMTALKKLIEFNRSEAFAAAWATHGKTMYRSVADLARDLEAFYKGEGLEVMDSTQRERAVLFTLPVDGIQVALDGKKIKTLTTQRFVVAYYPNNKKLPVQVVDTQTGLSKFAPMYDSAKRVLSRLEAEKKL